MDNKNIDSIAYLKEENKFLLDQLHIVQVELEKLYGSKKEYDKNQLYSLDGVLVEIPNEVNSILIDNIKLRTQVNLQLTALKIEKHNTLSARLGEILIKGSTSSSEILKIPLKLFKIWRALNKHEPPTALGKNFENVINEYSKGGITAVEKLFESNFISSVMQANAYTTLARYVKDTDKQECVILAKKAWETDPQLYRLKWLAFRLHEASDTVTADVILDMLPQNIIIKDSEKRHAQRIKDESLYIRTEEAKKEIELLKKNILNKKSLQQHIAYNEANKELKSQISKLIQENKKNNEYIKIQDYKIKNLQNELELTNNSKINKNKEENIIMQKNEIIAHQSQQIKQLKEQLSNQIKKLNNEEELNKKLQNDINLQNKNLEFMTKHITKILKKLINKFESNTTEMTDILKIIIEEKKIN